MIKITFTARALKNMDEIFQYIALDNFEQAKKEIEKIKDVTDQLKIFPKSGRIVPEKKDENIREIILPPYRIIYKILNSKHAEILMVFRSEKFF